MEMVKTRETKNKAKGKREKREKNQKRVRVSLFRFYNTQ